VNLPLGNTAKLVTSSPQVRATSAWRVVVENRSVFALTLGNRVDDTAKAEMTHRSIEYLWRSILRTARVLFCVPGQV